MNYVSASHEPSPSYPILAFFHEVHQLYAKHFLLFLRIVAPATVLGALVILLATSRSNEMFSHIPLGPEIRFHLAEAVAARAVLIAGLLVSWIANTFAFGAIAQAVSQVSRGQRPLMEDCYAPVRERAGRIVMLAIVLSVFLGFGLIAVLAVSLTIVLTLRSMGIALNSIPIGLVAFPAFVLALALVSTFGLSIPATILEDCGIAAALRRSRRLTRKSFGTLLFLVGEALLSGYVGGLLPFWIAWWLMPGPRPVWINWVLTACSAAIVTVANIVFLLGLALLYVKLRAAEQEQKALWPRASTASD